MTCSILLRLVADQNSWEEQWLLTNCHFFQSCISVVFYQTCEPYVILILGSFINCCAQQPRRNYELLPEIIWGLKTSEIEFRSDNLSFDQIVEYWELGCQFQEKWGVDQNFEEMPEEITLSDYTQVDFDKKLNSLLELSDGSYREITRSAREYYMNCSDKHPHEVVKRHIEEHCELFRQLK